MKIKGLLLATLSLVGMSSAVAQGVEYDDMYFSAEDRAKLNQQRTTELALNTTKKSKGQDWAEENESANPTDSYSARNINPEYTAREHTQSAQVDEEDYFVNNYQYNRNQLNNWNNNFNNWYSNPWYRSNYYGPGINTWNSPYYGYDSWNSPWYDPYWSHNGWSSSFSYHFGNSWNYGWGGSYNYWNRPYYGWHNPYSAWDPYMGSSWYGSGYWNNYRYPGTIVVVNPGERGNVVYGKRPTRGTSIVTERSNVRSRSDVSNSVRDNNSGRISDQNTRQDAYYDRYSRQRSTSNPSSSYDSRTNTQQNRSSSWNNNSWNNNSGYNNNRTSSPSYSSPSNSNTGSGTRTNSGTSSGGRRGRD
ncbi:MAG: hypothetical protein WA874_11905 [Chryseosolibacter sp.]